MVFVSGFAVLLAGFGDDYRPRMQDLISRPPKTGNVEIIWASTREVFNVVEADTMGCHIITAPNDVLKKLPDLGSKSGAELSRMAVSAFRDDAVATGLALAMPASRAAE
ncbi:MAG: transaldolase family protein, partial [Pseudolabrys sp.]